MDSKVINILYIIWSLGLGGAEQVVINLAKGLDKNKFRPFICCLNDEGKFADELKKEGIQVFALKKIKGVDFSVVPKLVKIIRENDIDIVHTHLWGANFWGRFAAKASGVRGIIATEHGIQEYRGWLHFFIDRWLSRFTNKIIFVCSFVRENYWRKISVDYDRTTVIYNGVDVSSYGRQAVDCKMRGEFGIAEGEKVVSVIGRLAPEKGHVFFLNAISRLNLDTNKVKVLIVGDGPLLESLKLKVKSEKLEDKIKFLGFRKDIPEILKITDVLVLPSSREGLPMILLEAMAAGAVVVATRVGGTPELVQDGVNGFLAEYGDVEGLKKKLEYVLNADDGSRSDLGPERRGSTLTRSDLGPEQQGSTSVGIDEIRKNARKTVEEKFSLEKMVGEYERVYAEVMS